MNGVSEAGRGGRISAGLVRALRPLSEPQFLICRVGQVIPASRAVSRIKLIHTKHLAQLILPVRLHPTLPETDDFSVGLEPTTGFCLMSVRPQEVRVHFRCVKTETGMVVGAQGLTWADLSSKPRSEGRFYHFLFCTRGSDQIPDTLLPHSIHFA